MNNIVKSCLVLFIISSVCVTALAYANEITLEPIRLQDVLAESNAFKEIFPEADEFKKGEIAAPQSENITEITTANKGGERVGYIVRLAQKGFGGPINMMVGIKEDGSISGITVLSHSETPGLGAACENERFTDMYKGKSNFPLSVVKMGAKDNEIDAITSATITTKAVTDAVNDAHKWFETEGGGK